MDKPLWQHFLTILMLSIAAHRGLAGYTLSLVTDIGTATILATYGLQVLAAVATALGIFLGRSWSVAPLLALGAAIAGTALYEGFALDARSGAAAVSQLGVVGVSTGLLFFVLRHEFPARGREEAEGHARGGGGRRTAQTGRSDQAHSDPGVRSDQARSDQA